MTDKTDNLSDRSELSGSEKPGAQRRKWERPTVLLATLGETEANHTNAPDASVKS